MKDLELKLKSICVREAMKKISDQMDPSEIRDIERLTSEPYSKENINSAESILRDIGRMINTPSDFIPTLNSYKD